MGKEFVGEHVFPGALGTHVAEGGGRPFVSRVAVGVHQEGFLLQLVESRRGGAGEEVIHPALVVASGDDHLLRFVFDADHLLAHDHLGDLREGGRLLLLICAALHVVHLLHGLGVDVVEVDQFIKGLQLNWWGPHRRRWGGRYWVPPSNQQHLRLLAHLLARLEEQLWVKDVQNAQQQIRLEGPERGAQISLAETMDLIF